jgi:predicted acylesterase/phospholipase RssA
MIRNRKNYDNSKHQLLSSNNDINNNYNSFQIENDTIEKYIENKDYNHIETLVFSSTEMYTLSILGHIDKLLISKKLKLNNIKNYVSSSLGTIVTIYLAFQYSPKQIIQIFYNNLLFINDNILNIVNTFGIFEISCFINKLLEPIYIKLGCIPTLKDIYNLTNVNCVFIGYNFTKNKINLYNYKTYPETKIDEIIQKCCIIPFLFKKYTNNSSKIDLEDLYIDYSLIDDNEYDYAIKLFNKSKLLLLKTSIIYEDENINMNDISIFEYAKNVFETIQNRQKDYIDNSYYSNIININVKRYNKILLFDDFIKYKEFINLYCEGFDNSPKYIDNNINKTPKNIDNSLQNDSIYTGIVISGGGTNVFNLVGGIKYCLEKNIINLNDIDIFIGTSAGSFICTMLVLNFNIEDVIDVYVNDISKKLNFNFKNIHIIERINEKSIYSNKVLIEGYEQIFIKHNDGQIPTLLDIKNKYGKNIIYTVFNLTKNKLEYINYENSPDLLVTHACAMSSCIPFVFNPIEYNKCFYIDGGIKSNYSVEVTGEYSHKKFIGFGINYLSNYSKISINEFLYHFIPQNSRKYQVTKIKKSTNCDSYCMTLVYDDDREGESLLVVTKNIITKYMELGYKYMENKLKLKLKLKL